jgi:hypothetical protein
MSIRSLERIGRNGSRARKTKACAMSNCVVSGRRLSPRTTLGRKIVRGTSGRRRAIMYSQNFFVRA